MSRESENKSAVIFRCTHCGGGIHSGDEHEYRGDLYHGYCLDEMPEQELESESMGPLPSPRPDLVDVVSATIVFGGLALWFYYILH